MKRGKIEARSESFGQAFKHFIYQELYTHSKYSEKDDAISYWRTTSQIEVDFVLGDHDVALEINGTNNIQSRNLRRLKSFAEEYWVKRLIVVSDYPLERKIGKISVLPWKNFLKQIWKDIII